MTQIIINIIPDGHKSDCKCDCGNVEVCCKDDEACCGGECGDDCCKDNCEDKCCCGDDCKDCEECECDTEHESAAETDKTEVKAKPKSEVKV